MNNRINILSDFSEFQKVFIEENHKHNLISKNDEKYLYEKHIYDSLSLKIFLDKYGIKSGNILDIGCGGGFPSIPLAIELKDFHITAIDSIQKKINSVIKIKEALNLSNMDTICGRVENLNKAVKYDIVVSRAVAKLSTICEYALPITKANGYFVAYKSKRKDEEISDAKNILEKFNAKIIDIIEYNLPTEELYERNLVVIKI